MWRLARSEQVEALQQVQEWCVYTRRASCGVSPPTPGRPEPRSAETAMRTARSRFEGWGGREEPSCVLPRPLLKFRRPPFAAPGVRPTQSPAPKSGQLREQSWGCQAGSRAAGRERGEPAGSALCALSGCAGGLGHLCRRAAASPWPRPGAPRATEPT